MNAQNLEAVQALVPAWWVIELELEGAPVSPACPVSARAVSMMPLRSSDRTTGSLPPMATRVWWLSARNAEPLVPFERFPQSLDIADTIVSKLSRAAHLGKALVSRSRSCVGSC